MRTSPKPKHLQIGYRNMVIGFDELEKIRKEHADKKIVFCSGVFDLTHAGHVLFFEECKALGDILLVALGSDASVKNYKGPERPIINEHMRAKLVSSLKPVDYCYISTAVKKGDPLHDMKNIFQKLRPDVYVVNGDAFDLSAREKLAREFGAKLAVLKRACPPEFEEVSATKIIEKLKGSA